MLASGVETSGRRLEGVYRERQVKLAIELFGLMGISREDRKGRDEWLKRGFRFFDAPAAIIISADKELGESSSFFDCGALTQTICLAALSFGLGTCIVGQGVMFPEVVRSFTGIPSSQRLVIGIALGYPDRDFPANKLISQREPVDDTVSWCRDN
jgi:nitroreductase